MTRSFSEHTSKFGVVGHDLLFRSLEFLVFMHDKFDRSSSKKDSPNISWLCGATINFSSHFKTDEFLWNSEFSLSAPLFEVSPSLANFGGDDSLLVISSLLTSEETMSRDTRFRVCTLFEELASVSLHFLKELPIFELVS